MLSLDAFTSAVFPTLCCVVLFWCSLCIVFVLSCSVSHIVLLLLCCVVLRCVALRCAAVRGGAVRRGVVWLLLLPLLEEEDCCLCWKKKKEEGGGRRRKEGGRRRRGGGGGGAGGAATKTKTPQHNVGNKNIQIIHRIYQWLTDNAWRLGYCSVMEQTISWRGSWKRGKRAQHGKLLLWHRIRTCGLCQNAHVDAVSFGAWLQAQFKSALLLERRRHF